MKIDALRANPELLIRQNGLIYGLSFFPPCNYGSSNKSRGAVIGVRINKGYTLLGFGVTPEDFDVNYVRAIDKLLEFAGISVSPELHARLVGTKYAFLQKYGIKPKQITVWEFPERGATTLQSIANGDNND